MDATQPPPPPESTTEAPLPPYVLEPDRCMKNVWNQKPGPSAADICPQYGCYSCCNEQKAVDHYHGFATEEITHYGPYRFDGCTSSGQHDTTNTGKIFFINNFQTRYMLVIWSFLTEIL